MRLGKLGSSSLLPLWDLGLSPHSSLNVCFFFHTCTSLRCSVSFFGPYCCHVPCCLSDCRNLSPRFRTLELPDHHCPLDSGAADGISEMMSPTANQKASGLFQKLSKESSDWLSWDPGAMKDIWCDILHRESLALMSMTRIVGTLGLPVCGSVTLPVA